MKVSELEGAALDWAVAKCEIDMLWIGEQAFCSDEYGNEGRSLFTPSTDWAQGGPIIEREWLQVTPWPNESDEDMRWHCVQHDAPVQCHAFGPTPLIAAMRCYVASKLGDEVTIPEEVK